MKTCGCCREEKVETEFAHLKNGKWRSTCKECQRFKSKKHYEKNKEDYFERNKKHRAVVREFIRELKSNTPCTDCGRNFHYCVMDFDHRPGVEKVEEVSGMGSRTWKQVKEEIAKCDVVCSNCHRVRTFERKNRI